MTILDKHIHMPKAKPPSPHRLIAIDSTHLRCADCQQTLDVANLTAPSRPAAAVQPPTKAEECPRHVGQHRFGCGPCAGEAKGRPDDELAPRPIRSGADPAAVPEVQAVKEQLAERAAARRRAARAPVSPTGGTVDTPADARGGA